MADDPPPLLPSVASSVNCTDQPGCSMDLPSELPGSSSFSDSDDMEFDGGYTEIVSRRLKRKLSKTPTECGPSVCTKRANKSIVPAKMPHQSSVSKKTTNEANVSEQSLTYTISYMPVEEENLNSINRQTLTLLLERLVPGQVKEVRINARRNILSVDVSSRATLDKLKTVSVLGNIRVRSFFAHGLNTTAGVISDVDIQIKDMDLVQLLSSSVRITDIHRFGKSRCVKLVFEGTTLPSHVKVGFVRHPVRPYVPRPVQCRKCQKIGHVSAACTSTKTCPRCGGVHDGPTCTIESPVCANCKGPHEATSRECPKVKTEMKILKKMVRDHSTHREAAIAVRRSRRRTRSRQKKLSSVNDVSTHQEDRDRSAAQKPLPPAPQEPRLTTPQEDPAEWPLLPSRTVSSVTRPPVRPPAVSTTDDQIRAMLKQLIGTLRLIIAGVDTPIAKAAVQILDAIEPVLATL